MKDFDKDDQNQTKDKTITKGAYWTRGGLFTGCAAALHCSWLYRKLQIRIAAKAWLGDHPERRWVGLQCPT